MTLPVSVIIPTHNSQSTISRALLSVFAQTKLPSEVIVVDDGSSDSTCDVVQKIAEIAPCPTRLILLDTNVGPSLTRNTGWDLATQELIAFLDSDDSWHDEKLAVQCAWMMAHPECLITGHLTDSTKNKFDITDIKSRTFDLRDFLIRNRVSTPTVMLRREITDRFDSSLWYAEDYELWLRILHKTHSFVRLEYPLTQLHKAAFGESGLSSKLFQMYKGELTAICLVRSRKQISVGAFSVFIVWKTLKYLLRIFRTMTRQLT